MPLKSNWVTGDQYTAADQNAVASTVNNIETGAFQFLNDTAAGWSSSNPILKAGQPGYATDSGRLKIGDGVTRWNDLTYVQVGQNKMWTTAWSESFTGTNGALISTLPNWSKRTDGFSGSSTDVKITNNQIYCSRNGGYAKDIYWNTTAVGSTTQFVELQIVTPYTGANEWYQFGLLGTDVQNPPDGTNLGVRVSGTGAWQCAVTNLGATTQASNFPTTGGSGTLGGAVPAAGDVLRVEVQGKTVSIYLNGISKASYTFGASQVMPTGSLVGLILFGASTGIVDNARGGFIS